MVSQFTCSFRSRLPNDFTIIGSKGRIHLPAMFWSAREARLYVEGEEPEVFQQEFDATGFEYQMREVIDSMHRGQIESVIHPMSSTIGNLRTMDQILAKLGVNYPFAPREL